MQIYIHKILPVFFLPIGITLIFMLFGLLCNRRSFIWIGFSILLLVSTPFVSDFFVRYAEAYAVRSKVAEVPRVDAIVVLSGSRLIAPGVEKFSEWGDVNRFLGGVELFKAGKSPLLIFTGGWSPWQPNAEPEGKLLVEYAQKLGIPAKNVLTTHRVMNTAEEANAVSAILLQGSLFSKKILHPHVLLVTSAFHMPRAVWQFERDGIKVTPFPVDFKVPTGGELSILDFIPNARAIEHTELAWREIYGRLYYLATDFFQ